MRWIAIRQWSALVLVVLLSGLGSAATLHAQKERFTEETTVVVIELPVQVMLGSEPVRDLTADDFEVLEGRKRQEIVGFDVFDLSLSSARDEPLETMSVSTTARRHFLLFFDLSFSRPTSIVKARQAALDLLENKFHPADLVAVATYSGSGGVKMVLGFTSDRQQATYAIETLGLAQPLARVSDPMALMIAEMQGTMVGGIAAAPAGGARGDAEVLSMARDLQAMSGRAARDQRQNQILALTSSLANMAGLLNSVPGRVQVMLLSEGFDSSVMLGNEGLTNEDRARVAEINRAAASGEMWKVDSEERFGSGAALSAMDQMLEEFRRADCVIQSVDIGGLRAGGEASGVSNRGSGTNRDNSLFIMADGTGGEHYRNFNNLGDAMETLLERTSVTYVLAIQPQDLKLDGSYHRLKVKLKDGPKGAQLVHRPGYYAPKPYAEQTGLERQLAAAGLIMGGNDGGEIGAAVLATPLLVPDEKAYVPVLVEVNGGDLIGAGQQGVVPTELYAYAIDSNGSISDFFARTMTLDLTKVGPALERSGFKYWGRLDLAAGDYVIRVLVRNGGTGATGVKTSSITVPSASQGPPYLLPALFPEPMGKWVLARDSNVENEAYPFMANGTPFLPAARPVLTPGEVAPVCLLESGLEGTTGSLSAELIGAEGESAGEVALELVGGGGEAFPGYECLQANLAVPDLERGEYRLVVTLDDGSAAEARSSEMPLFIDG